MAGAFDLPRLQLIRICRTIALAASCDDSRSCVGIRSRIPSFLVLLVLDEAASLVLRRCHRIDLLDLSARFLKGIDTAAVNDRDVFVDLSVNRSRACFPSCTPEKKGKNRRPHTFYDRSCSSRTLLQFISLSFLPLLCITSRIFKPRIFEFIET